jgi:ABC-type uncharacterized transport system ATPase subunit
MATALLELKGLVKRFGATTVADNVDLSIMSGEIRCLIGPNGAGKSSLLNLIAGKTLPDAGQIIFDGELTEKLPMRKRIRAGMGIKFQVPSVFETISVAENLVVAAHRPGRAPIKIPPDEMIGRIGLEKMADMPAGALSHGQKQWLEIGMATMQLPTMLLLDEPSAGMTPAETEKTGELIKKLNSDGITVLAVEHDMSFVRQIASSVTVLNLGRIFSNGSFEQISSDAGVVEIYLGHA